MAAGDPIPGIMRLPPPLQFALVFLVGVGVQRQWPLPVAVSEGLRSAGAVLALLGLLLALSCGAMFLIARTTILPHGQPRRLLRTGPYRYTRNPMYLSLTLVYLGAAAGFGQPWSALFIVVPVTLVNEFVIPYEERRLRQTFGEDYVRYCAAVRRWL